MQEGHTYPETAEQLMRAWAALDERRQELARWAAELAAKDIDLCRREVDAGVALRNSQQAMEQARAMTSAAAHERALYEAKLKATQVKGD